MTLNLKFAPEELGSCPICGPSSRSLFIRHEGRSLYTCHRCRLVYLDPPPDEGTLAGIYTDPYAGATESYFRKAPKKIRSAHRTMRRLLRVLGRDPHGLRLLDVGCSGGFITQAAREAGFESFGIDPDAAAVTYARAHFPGITFINGFLDEVDLPDHSFDVIYCSEVIEHAPDCKRFMAGLARLSRAGGLLYLTTPDISHWRRPRDVTKWDAFCPPAHCLYFSPANLDRLLDVHGFTVLRHRFAHKPGIRVFAQRRSDEADSLVARNTA